MSFAPAAANSVPAPHRWVVRAACGAIVAFVAVGGWLAWIQLHEGGRYRALAELNLQRKSVLPPRRGAILDANGSPLAVSVPVKTVCGDPSLMGADHWLVARTLAPLLRLEPEALYRLVQPRLVTNASHRLVTNAYVVLRRKVPLDQWQQVTQAMANLYPGRNPRRLPARQAVALQALRERSILSEEDYLRQYPNRTLAAHVLGFAATEDGDTDQGPMLATHGWSGIELLFDRQLFGAPGWRKRAEEVAARAGLDVVLTLDAGVQNIVETELAKAMARHRPASISALAIRPRTGAILALANLPVFDPNRPTAGRRDAHRNRVLSDPAEPGSTFKVVVVGSALDAQAVTLERQIDCEHGRFVYAGRVLHDHASYGMLSVLNIVAKSSNIGAAKVALLLGQERLHRYLEGFGFGAPTGILLPGESRGTLFPLDQWQPLSISRVAMGHEVNVTPLQMAMAVACIANDGRLMRPMLVDRLQDDQGRLVWKYQPEVVRQAISPAAARLLTTAMKQVVQPGGTATKARLDYYTVAGKTGTAQKFVHGSYSSGKYFSSFLGFFPADNPELCISVVLDEPETREGYYGGEVAAPVFKTIAEQVAAYLRLPPEASPESRPEPRLQPVPGTPPAPGAVYAVRPPRATATVAATHPRD